ncbi:MAG: XdhC family protein [Bacteroidota bacterium]
MNPHPILKLAYSIYSKEPAVLATVIEARGSSPAAVGTQIVLLKDGTTAGTAGGGKLEQAILADAQAALTEATPRLRHYSLNEEGSEAIRTSSGRGEVTVFIQPFLPAAQLVIVGGGQIVGPLKVMAEAAGFGVVVVDARPGLDSVHLTEDSYVLLLTGDQVSDEGALRKVIDTRARYIGMIGSHARCQTILGHLEADGYTDEELARVYAPIGLDLGGTSPEEIAVAILAEVITVRRGGKGGSRAHRLLYTPGGDKR